MHLPNFDSILSHNEVATSTALGHCSHLVYLLSQFLDIPLQYRVEYRGSRSLIYETVCPSLIAAPPKNLALVPTLYAYISCYSHPIITLIVYHYWSNFQDNILFVCIVIIIRRVLQAIIPYM